MPDAFKIMNDIVAKNAEQAQEQTRMIAEVERLPVFRGRRMTSHWIFYEIPVTPKTAEFVLDRIRQANTEINRQTNAELYREAWEEMIWYMSRLAAIEHKIRWNGEKPSQLLLRMKLQYNDCLFAFLDRYAAMHWEHRILPLKTERGKLNRAKEFLPWLDDMWSNMTKIAREKAHELAALEVSRIHQLYKEDNGQ